MQDIEKNINAQIVEIKKINYLCGLLRLMTPHKKCKANQLKIK